MGYHVSIIRTIHGKNSPLSQDEVMKAAARVPGWQYNQESSDASFFDNGEEVVTLWYDDGELWAKNPSGKAIDAMIQLAIALNARVRGDELETYRSSEETYQHPDDSSLIAGRDEALRQESKKIHIGQLLFRAYQVITISFLIFLSIRYLWIHK